MTGGTTSLDCCCRHIARTPTVSQAADMVVRHRSKPDISPCLRLPLDSSLIIQRTNLVPGSSVGEVVLSATLKDTRNLDDERIFVGSIRWRRRRRIQECGLDAIS